MTGTNILDQNHWGTESLSTQLSIECLGHQSLHLRVMFLHICISWMLHPRLIDESLAGYQCIGIIEGLDTQRDPHYHQGIDTEDSVYNFNEITDLSCIKMDLHLIVLLCFYSLYVFGILRCPTCNYRYLCQLAIPIKMSSSLLNPKSVSNLN